MNVSLNKHYDTYIQNEVKSGRYNSASEVIRAALRLLEERDKAKQAEVEWYRKEIQKGLDSGPAKVWDKDEFLRKAKERAGIINSVED